MNAHSIVEDWEDAPFAGGFDGLTALSDSGFDGVVETTETWLFFRAGEPIAVVSDLDSNPSLSDLDVFENASGTQYTAPNSASATLAAMLALDGEVRGRYFTDDTPLSRVHETLSEGGFTGYVELSENVLSGDYYYVYVDGEVDHVGFVGSSQRLFGEDAQTRAENEIGIYAVAAVSLPELTLPEPAPEPVSEPEPEPERTPAAVDSPASGSDSPDLDSDSAAGPEPSAGGDVSSPKSDAESTAAVASDTANSEASEDSETNDPTHDPATDTAPAAGTDTPAATAADSASPSTAESASTEATETKTRDGDDGSDDGSETTDVPTAETADDSEPESETRSVEEDPSTTAAHSDRSDTRRTADPYPSAASDSSGRRSKRHESAGIRGLASHEVPSLDPKQSSHTEPSSSQSAHGSVGYASESNHSTQGDQRTARSDASIEQREHEGQAYEERIETLETELDERDEKIEALEAELDERETDISTLKSELAALRDERDELSARLEAMDGTDASASGGPSLFPEDALDGTSLFIREHTRGGATLEDAHGGAEDKAAVTENLRIEFHTTFESDGATVEGEAFEPWLRSSPAYAFAEWLVTELLFEIRSTNAAEGLRPLYDVIPFIDRIGFNESIPVGASSDGSEDEAETQQFDIVAKDKKGNPLIVAHFEQGREPTHADTIGPFVTASSNVCEANETLAAAVAVTSSYFEADAMSTTEEATSSSLLSRSKYRSYVKLSRSNGFHLCLVESRDGTFNMTVPEL